MFGNNFNNGGNTNNNTNAKNVNTRIRTFYGDLSALQLGYWNDNLSIRINPCIGQDETGVRKYDYNRRISTALTTDKARAIYKKIEEKILPVIAQYEKGESVEIGNGINVGVTVGQSSMIFVQLKEMEDGIRTQFSLFTNVVDGKVAPENVFVYKFNKTKVITELNEENEAVAFEEIESEFHYFCDKLKNMSLAAGDASHAMLNTAAFKSGGQNQNNYSQNNSQNTYSNNTNTNSYSAPIGDFGVGDLPFN